MMPKKRDKLLMIGGTNFIGRNLIEHLLVLDQFDITLFNRGITNPNIFPQINRISGDRDSEDVRKINATAWDYVIDCSCYYPQSLENILSSLQKNIKKYIFISTCSVYDTHHVKTILRNEESAIQHCSSEEREDPAPSTYGKRKAECERILIKSGLPYITIRPALVYGKYDPTDRLYYWLYQIHGQKELLIPNRGENKFSVTYIDDLVKAISSLLHSNLTQDTYNIITHPTLSIAQLVNTASQQLNAKPKLNYLSTNYLNAHNIREWTDLPLWIDNNYFTFDNAKIVKEDLFQFSDFEASLRHTIEYYAKQDWPMPQYGLAEKKKLDLLKEFKTQNN